MNSRTTSATRLPVIPAGFRRNLEPFYSPKVLYMQSSTPQALTNHLTLQNDGINFNNHSKRMFIFGMGYVAQFFAQELKNEGWDVSGTCSSITKKQELEQKGFDVHVFDACSPEWKILDVVGSCTHLLISIPPDLSTGDLMLQHHEYFKTRLVDGNLQWLSYLSSTSVYGDCKGAWIDEDYSPKPSDDKAKIRLNAEEGWLNLGQDLGLSSYVFRLGGIYGPGRSAIDTILKKEPLSESRRRRSTRTFTSRVHVADICQALRASISVPFRRKIYNVVDDDPASRAEVFAFAQHLIETKWPALIYPTVFYRDTVTPEGGQKRVSNARIKKELGMNLLYPCYRSGLQSIIDHI